MELKEKLMKKHKGKVKKAKLNFDGAKTELNRTVDNYNLTARVVGNVERLREMNDYEVRESNLLRILASDRSKILLEFSAHPEVVIHYDISEKFYGLIGWLVKEQRNIYNLEFGRMGGLMTGRSLKEGHNKDEFDDSVWDKVRGWISQYNKRRMKEELYNSIMNDNFDSLHERLVQETLSSPL